LIICNAHSAAELRSRADVWRRLHGNREDNPSDAGSLMGRTEAKRDVGGRNVRSAEMSEQRRTANPGNFAVDREKASRAGQLGGQHSSGNFAHNRERAAQAGRKGGERSRGGGGAGHNPGNFAQDRERASQAGRRGGEQRRSGSDEPGNHPDANTMASEVSREGEEPSEQAE
jgi:uncharacterized protein